MTFLIYNSQEEGENLWTKEHLIAIRDLERRIKNDPTFNTTCFMEEIPEYDEEGNKLPPLIMPDGEVNARCQPDASFRSVTDLVEIVTGRDASELEQLRVEEIDAILTGALEIDELWRNFKTLFDSAVSLENPRVNYVRSQLLLAGPLRIMKSSTESPDGTITKYYNRYSDISDDRDA